MRRRDRIASPISGNANARLVKPPQGPVRVCRALVVGAVVLMVRAAVTLPVPGVTLVGEKLHDERLGSPEHQKVIGELKARSLGLLVMSRE
jgi:hypothetical protein